MIKWLEHIDQELLLLINGWHSPLFDFICWNLSKAISLVPFYVITLYFLIKDYSLKKSLILLGFMLVTLSITDIVSTQVFKEGVKRYRPSHHITIGPKVHLYEERPGEFYRGGQFGFFSSHAANLAGFICFIYPWFTEKRRYWNYILLGIGILVCYSRMYLGVHYPSDILAGILFGAFVGWGIRLISRKLISI
jgi:undecaprenyl-diphosphatase